jgi:hypothetical protein
MTAMNNKSGERFKGAGFILISIGTLGLVVNDFIFNGPAAVTISFAAVDVIGLACLITGGLITRKKSSA